MRIIFILLLIPSLLFAKSTRWITVPNINESSYGVYHFRCSFTLNEVPFSHVINISADNRFKLYINDVFVTLGPARGDLMNWRFDEIDIESYLRPGKNTIAVLVWNAGFDGPVAQHSFKTGLYIESSNQADSLINTGVAPWKCLKSDAWLPENVTVPGYYAIGVCDNFIAANQLWGWTGVDFNDSQWSSAEKSGSVSKYESPYGNDRHLCKNHLPLMEHTYYSLTNIVKSSVNKVQQFPLTIPASSVQSFILDAKVLQIGYPEIQFSNGLNATIKLTYAESLYDSISLLKNKFLKLDRNKVQGCEIAGYHDFITADGGVNRVFEPLWNRTFRYIKVDVQTKNEALIINKIGFNFSAYPFIQKAEFKTNDLFLSEVFNVGWRTARLCAGETYFDCPYYEQLQYIGDTRIQALISLYISGDDRLMRNALALMNSSRLPNGLTQSRYPSRTPQLIPGFSLYYIEMLHDYYMHRSDSLYIKQFLPGIKGILDYYASNQLPNGLVRLSEWWPFVDWTKEYSRGIPHGGMNGQSAVINLQYSSALRSASMLFKAFGEDEQAAYYYNKHLALNDSVMKYCFNAEKGLIAQTPGGKIYSQHANILGILADAIPQSEQKQICKILLQDTSLIESSIYFKFYLFQALWKVGMANEYLTLLGDWKEMLDMGMTTFGEELSKPRSDCHAWSASPCYDFLATVCGIRPLESGFKKVLIAPNPGSLSFIKATMPHELGLIKIDVKFDRNTKATGIVVLPDGLRGLFLWNNKEVLLVSGENKINL